MGGFYGMQIISSIKLLKRCLKKNEQQEQALLERWWARGHVDLEVSTSAPAGIYGGHLEQVIRLPEP